MVRLLLALALTLLLALLAPQSADAAPPALPPGQAEPADVTIDTTPLEIELSPLTLAALSPNGARVAAYIDGELCIYDIEGGAPRCQSGMRSVGAIAWSPDSSSIVFHENFYLFFHESDLWWMDAETGEMRTLTPDTNVIQLAEPNPFDGSDVQPLWLDADEVAFLRFATVAGEQRLVPHRMQIPNGEPEPLPFTLPPFADDWDVDVDADLVVYAVWRADEEADAGVWLQPLSGGPSQQILPGGEDAGPAGVSFAPDGDAVLLWLRTPGGGGAAPSGSVRIYDLEAGELSTPLWTDATHVGWLPNGSGLLASTFIANEIDLTLLPSWRENDDPRSLGSYAPQGGAIHAAHALDVSNEHSVLVWGSEEEQSLLLRISAPFLAANNAPAATPAEPFVEYRNPGATFTLSYPRAWELDEDAAEVDGVRVILISDEAFFDGEPGAFVVVEENAIEDGPEDVDEAQQRFLGGGGLAPIQISATYTSTADYDAVTGVYLVGEEEVRGGLTITATTLVLPMRTLSIARGVSYRDDGTYAALVTRILASIDLGTIRPFASDMDEPQRTGVAAVAPGFGKLETATFASDFGDFRMHYPAGWTLDLDDDEQRTTIELLSVDKAEIEDGPTADQSVGVVFATVLWDQTMWDEALKDEIVELPQLLQRQWIEEEADEGIVPDSDWMGDSRRAYRTYSFVIPEMALTMRYHVVTLFSEEGVVHLAGGVTLPDPEQLEPVVLAVLASAEVGGVSAADLLGASTALSETFALGDDLLRLRYPGSWLFDTGEEMERILFSTRSGDFTEQITAGAAFAAVEGEVTLEPDAADAALLQSRFLAEKGLINLALLDEERDADRLVRTYRWTAPVTGGIFRVWVRTDVGANAYLNVLAAVPAVQDDLSDLALEILHAIEFDGDASTRGVRLRQ